MGRQMPGRNKKFQHAEAAHHTLPIWGGRCPEETRNSNMLKQPITHYLYGEADAPKKQEIPTGSRSPETCLKCLLIHQNGADFLLPTFGKTEVNVHLYPPLCHSVVRWGKISGQ